MKITFDLTTDEVSVILRMVSEYHDLHKKLVFGMLTTQYKEMGYVNTTGYGPTIIPYDLKEPGSTVTFQQHILGGQYILAIKLVRAVTGIGLKEAKDIVDKITGKA